MKEGNVYCIRDAPHQNGDLWVEVTPEHTVRVLSPVSEFWRFREFTMQEFRDILTDSQ